MGKHFGLRLEEDQLHYERRREKIEQEAALGGLYVIRTSESATSLCQGWSGPSAV